MAFGGTGAGMTDVKKGFFLGVGVMLAIIVVGKVTKVL